MISSTFDTWFMVGAIAFVPPTIHLFGPFPIWPSLVLTFVYTVHVIMMGARHGMIRGKAVSGAILVFFEAWLLVDVTPVAILFLFIIYAISHFVVERANPRFGPHPSVPR